MLSKKSRLAKLCEKTEHLAKRALHQLKKGHFCVKEKLTGVTLTEKLQHKMQCFKQETLQKKQSIDSRFNQFAAKITRTVAKKLYKTSPLLLDFKNFRRAYEECDERFMCSIEQVTSTVKKFFNPNALIKIKINKPRIRKSLAFNPWQDS